MKVFMSKVMLPGGIARASSQQVGGTRQLPNNTFSGMRAKCHLDSRIDLRVLRRRSRSHLLQKSATLNHTCLAERTPLEEPLYTDRYTIVKRLNWLIQTKRSQQLDSPPNSLLNDDFELENSQQANKAFNGEKLFHAADRIVDKNKNTLTMNYINMNIGYIYIEFFPF